MKKRRQRKIIYEMRHTAISLNPSYYECSFERVEIELSAHGITPCDGAPCGWQKQIDSGDVLLFFRTQWPRNRKGVQVSRWITAPPYLLSPIVFSMMHEGEIEAFEENVGYDVAWDTIAEIEWEVFVPFVEKIVSDSLEAMLKLPKVEGGDYVTCYGDVRWIPRQFLSAMLKKGRLQTNDDWKQLVEFDAHMQRLKEQDS